MEPCNDSFGWVSGSALAIWCCVDSLKMGIFIYIVQLIWVSYINICTKCLDQTLICTRFACSFKLKSLNGLTVLHNGITQRTQEQNQSSQYINPIVEPTFHEYKPYCRANIS